ncbi:hypothetical protein [Paenibacillus glycanilyticus]|uniref:Uncharacterized protein n=1 Tax=Paenibacillus glycanilyticus TaxID=126569 RepID=A0ABQ6GDT8_9BACL|nr:hypothetical protein [Paenibacillus glycanilyticus]GLX67746.1 hypothetical protein MU1_20910 [Paenibacillus glycanilyticus]
MEKDNMNGHELDYTDKSTNKVASFLIFLTWAVIIIGFIVPFVPRQDDTKAPFLPTVFEFILIGVFIRVMAEIVKLLHSINHKLK